MKKLLSDFPRVFIIYFAAMGLSLLGGALLAVPLRFLIEDYNDITEFIVGFVIAVIAMAVLSFMEGRRTGAFDLKTMLFALAAMLCLLALITYIIGRAIYISGPTDYLAVWLALKAELPPDAARAQANSNSLLLMACAYVSIYAPVMLLGKLFGAKS